MELAAVLISSRTSGFSGGVIGNGNQHMRFLAIGVDTGGAVDGLDNVWSLRPLRPTSEVNTRAFSPSE